CLPEIRMLAHPTLDGAFFRAESFRELHLGAPEPADHFGDRCKSRLVSRALKTIAVFFGSPTSFFRGTIAVLIWRFVAHNGPSSDRTSCAIKDTFENHTSMVSI